MYTKFNYIATLTSPITQVVQRIDLTQLDHKAHKQSYCQPVITMFTVLQT